MASSSNQEPSVSRSDCLRIVLVGKSGGGKSSTGNTLLGDKIFKTEFAASSVTEGCQEATCDRSGQKILLVDTPGMFDTEKTSKQVMQEISKCVSLSLPGPHVFLLVLEAGRFTKEEHKAVKRFVKLFGEEAFKHMILVFTRKDELERKGVTLEDYLKKIPPSLDTIIKQCEGRCIAVNNSSETRAIESRNLMELINALVNTRDGKYYTNEMFEAAEKKCREREEEIKLQKEQEKKNEKEELEKQLRKAFANERTRLKAEFMQKMMDIDDSFKQQAKFDRVFKLGSLLMAAFHIFKM